MATKYVHCIECGTVDKPRYIEKNRYEVGTSVKMICPDCENPNTKRAIKCRKCCPTNHGTFIYQDDFWEEWHEEMLKNKRGDLA
jgi:ribosomal protein L40E